MNIGYVDTLAAQNTVLHRLDPRAKLIVTLVYSVTVISFPHYSLSGLIPFFIYPALMIPLANIPFWYIVKRIGTVLPFALLIGVFNPVFDTTVKMQIGPLAVSGGWLSFISLVMRVVLTVSAVMILIATTGMYRMCMAMEKLGIPNVFAVQLLFVYRYLFVLIEEATRMARARALRSFSRGGLSISAFTSITGNLLIRTIDRAQRIHLAMLARGFDGTIRLVSRGRFGLVDLLYVCAVCGVIVLLRVYNIASIVGNILTGPGQ